MALENHIDSLKKRHARLDRTIREEEAHLGSDDMKVSRLKSQRLGLKDEIERLEHGRSIAA